MCNSQPLHGFICHIVSLSNQRFSQNIDFLDSLHFNKIFVTAPALPGVVTSEFWGVRALK